MPTPTMNAFNKIYPLLIKKYETLVPNENDSIIAKINSIVEHLNKVGKLSNDTVAQWNQVMKWVIDEGMTESVSLKLDQMFTTGQLSTIVNAAFAEFDTRLDHVESSLAENAKKGYLPFGEIKLPSDFVTLSFSLYRDFDGIIKHNFNFNQYKTGTKIYVDRTTGNDTTGNGTSGTPYKTLNKALTTARDGADTAYQIVLKTNRFDRNDYFVGEIIITDKIISIYPENTDNLFYLTNHTKGLTWTADGSAWKTTRSLCGGVCDIRVKDIYGVPVPYKHATSVADCQATVNTWYTDGTSVWVNTGGVAPDDTNYVIGTEEQLFVVKLLGTAKLYVENMILIGNSVTGTLKIVRGNNDGVNVSGEFCANGCIFTGGNQRSTGTRNSNGINTENLSRSYLFNCKTAYESRDGFNYHYVNIPTVQRRNCLAFEYNCISYSHGLLDTNGNNNATTAHEGVSVLRVNSIGYNVNGPVLADVNGCYSIALDCHMRDSLLANTLDTSASFYFDNVSASTTGKAILKNCSGKSPKYAISGQSGFAVEVENFNGNDVLSSLAITTI